MTSPTTHVQGCPQKHDNVLIANSNFEILLYHIVYIYMIRFFPLVLQLLMLLIFNFLYIMFVFLFLCIYTNPATGCYMNKTILYDQRLRVSKSTRQQSTVERS